jgi:hypothetical protein
MLHRLLRLGAAPCAGPACHACRVGPSCRSMLPRQRHGGRTVNDWGDYLSWPGTAYLQPPMMHVHVNQPRVTHAVAAPGTVMACPIPGTHHVCMCATSNLSSACLCAQPALTKRAPLSPTLAASSPRLAVATLDRNAKGLTGGRHGLGVSCGGRPLFYSGAGLRRCLHSSPRQEARCNKCLCAPHWLLVPGRGRSRNTPATNAGPAQKCVLWVSKATAGVARAPLSCRACTGCGQRL